MICSDFLINTLNINHVDTRFQSNGSATLAFPDHTKKVYSTLENISWQLMAELHARERCPIPKTELLFFIKQHPRNQSEAIVKRDFSVLLYKIPQRFSIFSF